MEEGFSLSFCVIYKLKIRKLNKLNKLHYLKRNSYNGIRSDKCCSCKRDELTSIMDDK